MSDRPDCACHAEPMQRSGVSPYGKQRWRCAVVGRARNRATASAWRERNPGADAEGKARWHDANRERINARRRARYAEKPRRRPAGQRASDARRRALARGALRADLTEDQWQAILAEHGDRCAYCGSAEALTQDHVVPVSRGGSHTRANVVPACRRCNASKKAEPSAAFVLRRLEVYARGESAVPAP